ncbi:MAG: YHS domain-containing protein [Chlorobi bacterium]|nr:YHS domain-containing protein [Chlorobiota bacterium]
MHGNQNTSVLIDPVCHESVNSDSAKYFEYMGQLYPFESDECMYVFKKNPEQFIANKPIFRNRQMQTFVSFVGGSVFMLGMMALMVF